MRASLNGRSVKLLGRVVAVNDGKVDAQDRGVLFKIDRTVCVLFVSDGMIDEVGDDNVVSESLRLRRRGNVSKSSLKMDWKLAVKQYKNALQS